jgi:hypothetical protein
VPASGDYRAHLDAINGKVAGLRAVTHDAEALGATSPTVLSARIDAVEEELAALRKGADRSVAPAWAKLAKDFHDEAGLVRPVRRSRPSRHGSLIEYMKALRDVARLLSDVLERIEQMVASEQVRLAGRRSELRRRATRTVVSLDISLADQEGPRRAADGS